jgi:D-hydroxyproline dehydrogenase subunit beta
VTPDVAVIGGGIVGCALAAFLAEGGARVTLYEREAIAAGASGRNSGVLQHPLDEALTDLYEESLGHYAALSGFDLPAEPSGLLLVTDRPEALEAPDAPGLGPEYLEGAALRAAEPALADGLVGYRLETGRPVPPAAAAHAFAERARAAGAELRIGAPARVAPGGVETAGEPQTAGAVVVAAGPWTPAAVRRPLPITPVWGVVVELALAHPPTHVLEEAGIDALTTEDVPDVLFSAVTARGISAVGSTFMPDEPDAEALAPRILANARRFLKDLGTRTGLRACARPGSEDGRPLLGRLDGDLYVAAGHGAWGITLGPASARLVADGLLGRDAPIPPALSAGRFGA